MAVQRAFKWVYITEIIRFDDVMNLKWVQFEDCDLDGHARSRRLLSRRDLARLGSWCLLNPSMASYRVLLEMLQEIVRDLV